MRRREADTERAETRRRPHVHNGEALETSAVHVTDFR